MVSENEFQIFHEDFLNKDISLHTAHKSIKFETYIHDNIICIEGRVSQNCDLGF